MMDDDEPPLSVDESKKRIEQLQKMVGHHIDHGDTTKMVDILRAKINGSSARPSAKGE
jgi:hypothetical protein